MALKKAERAEKIEALAKAIREAVAEASFYNTTPDTGTCNFDSTDLLMEGWSEKDMQEVANKSNIRLRKLNRDDWCIIGGTDGQGARRTRMAEAMTMALRARGYSAYTRYVID